MPPLTCDYCGEEQTNVHHLALHLGGAHDMDPRDALSTAQAMYERHECNDRDARTRAAAPELLTACQRALRRLSYDGVIAVVSDDQDLVDLLARVIAKTHKPAPCS